jgi:hypothetical protein
MLLNIFLTIKSNAMDKNQKDPGCCSGDSECCGGVTDPIAIGWGCC